MIFSKIKYLSHHDVVGAALKTIKIKKANAERLKLTFLYTFANVKARSMISTTSFNSAKSNLILLFSIFPGLITSFTALITFPAYPIISLLTSFLYFYRRDDGILKLGDILRIRIARLVRSLMANAKPNRV